jgi:ABC-2 type transport system ATP-binding protein
MDGINNTNVISVKDLTKDYGNGLGVFNIDLVIKKGETHGYLGPNGAGKTTTIRHILGFQKAENVDTITIDGVPV